MTDDEFFERSLEISTEFDRYVLTQPDLAEKIPQDALVVFIVEDDPEFNEKAADIARKRRESGQPLALVRMEKLRPRVQSRLVNPKLELASSI